MGFGRVDREMKIAVTHVYVMYFNHLARVIYPAHCRRFTRTLYSGLFAQKKRYQRTRILKDVFNGKNHHKREHSRNVPQR